MCDAQDLACVQNHRINYVGVDHLSAIHIVAITASSLIKHGLRIKLFVLNSYMHGCWDNNFLDVKGFPFTCPPVPTMITVQIEVTPTAFVISVNDIYDFGTVPISRIPDT